MSLRGSEAGLFPAFPTLEFAVRLPGQFCVSPDASVNGLLQQVHHELDQQRHDKGGAEEREDRINNAENDREREIIHTQEATHWVAVTDRAHNRGPLTVTPTRR